MAISLIILLAITILATYWARRLAVQRGRHAGGWVLATATLPHVVLILWALPSNRCSSKT